MSVSLREVIESGGYNLTTLEDAQWLLGQQSNFADIVEAAEAVVEESENES